MRRTPWRQRHFMICFRSFERAARFQRSSCTALTGVHYMLSPDALIHLSAGVGVGMNLNPSRAVGPPV